MKLKSLLLLFSTLFVSKLCYSQGCVINNYNGFNRVFNRPTAVGARTFMPGNGNNFVRWEGTCGTHTYVQTTSAASGTCTVTENGVTRTGDYYPTVSAPFTNACNVPLDDYLPVLILILGATSFFIIKRNSQFKRS